MCGELKFYSRHINKELGLIDPPLSCPRKMTLFNKFCSTSSLVLPSTLSMGTEWWSKTRGKRILAYQNGRHSPRIWKSNLKGDGTALHQVKGYPCVFVNQTMAYRIDDWAESLRRTKEIKLFKWMNEGAVLMHKPCWHSRIAWHDQLWFVGRWAGCRNLIRNRAYFHTVYLPLTELLSLPL